LQDALTNTNNNGIAVDYGTFTTNNYNVTAVSLSSSNSNTRAINLGSSTLTLSATVAVNFGVAGAAANLTFNAGTSSIVASSASGYFVGGSKDFYNLSYTNTTGATFGLEAVNSANNITVAGRASAGITQLSIIGNTTVTGTLTLSAGTNANYRTFVRSSSIGTTRTLTCAAVASLTDIDFRDITIAGAAAPVSGTRLGDCKGNSGITFDAAKTVYWNLAGSNNWSATGWATSSGGTPAVSNFPLAQDTAVFESTSPGTGTTTTINANYNIGTIDMSARTSNTMTLATAAQSPTIYGNWINGTGTTLTGTGTLTFAGRGSQTITSAGKTFTQLFVFNSPSGSVTLQDAFVYSSASITLTAGTFDANIYNVTSSATGTGNGVNITGSSSRTMAVGSGAWSIAGSGTAWQLSGSNAAVTGTGTISLTSASAKTFAGGGISYSDITLDQGGAGTLTISGNNRFKNITNTYSATGATNITISNTIQRVTEWTGTGTSGKVLTVQGTSATIPGTLILTGSTRPNVDYLTITGVRAYSLDTTWYAGTNSTNNGSLGWYFEVAPPASTGNFFLVF